MKKVFWFLVYSLILLFIGRSLIFIPQLNLNFKSQQQQSEDLRANVLQKFLKSVKGSYSIYYKDLKTGQSFGINENEVLTAASLNKIPIIMYLYSQAAAGKQNLEDKIVIQKNDIQDYGTGSIRYGGEGQSYSLKNLAKLSLEQSDNTAAHVLGIRLDLSNVQKYIKNLGFVSTNIANDKTTAVEMGKFLELIYNRKVTSSALTQEFLDFMKDTDFEDRIPRDLPKNVSVYHKTGDAIGMIHDVGIIDDGKNPFILSVLTSDITDEDSAKKTIGKIAKFIYDEQD